MLPTYSFIQLKKVVLQCPPRFTGDDDDEDAEHQKKKRGERGKTRSILNQINTRREKRETHFYRQFHSEIF